MLIDELRRRRILLPSAAVLEMIVHQARARAESTLHRARWSRYRHARVARSTSPMPENTTSRLAWLSSGPAIAGRPPERVCFVRYLASIGSDGAKGQEAHC
jgi:hypothetical protein